MFEGMTEAEVIKRAQAGDVSCFEVLYGLHKRRVFSLCLRMSGNYAQAEDFTQEAFLQLYRKIASFRGESAFSTWVYRLVVNSCLDHKRKAWRLIPIADELLSALRAPGDSLNAVLESEMRARVRAAVEKLTPDLRMVTVLRYTEGLSYDQIAEVLGCSPGTVASRLNRAHKALERRLTHFVNSQGGRHV